MLFQKKFKLTDELKSNLVLWRSQKLGSRAIGKLIGCSKKTATTLMREAGLETMKSGGQAELSFEFYNEIVRLYVDERLDCPTIGTRFGVGRMAIQDVLRKNGVDRRKKSEVSRIHNVNESFFEIIDTEEKAYWLGFLMADGCVVKHSDRKNAGAITLNLGKKDLEHLQKFKKSLKSDHPIRFPKKDNTCLVSIGSEKICKDLINLGCVPAKSKILKFPDFSLVPECVFRHFIRGYFDGDGSICWSNRKQTREWTAIFYTSSYFTRDLKDFFTKVLNTGGGIAPRPGIFALQYTGNRQCEKIFDYLYKDTTIYLERKYKRYLIFKEQRAGNFIHYLNYKQEDERDALQNL